MTRVDGGAGTSAAADCQLLYVPLETSSFNQPQAEREKIAMLVRSVTLRFLSAMNGPLERFFYIFQ
jgi:hypothetical protein